MKLAQARQILRASAHSVPTLVLIALLVLGGWLAARWFVYFATPSETRATPVRERVQLSAAAQTLADGHLFGVAQAGSGAAVSNLNVKLKGVFAGGSSGLAILNVGGKDEATPVGKELVPGVILNSVHPHHVMLSRNGELERVNLEERIVPVSPGPRAAGPRPAPRAATVPVPAPAQGPAVGASAAPSPGPLIQRPEPYAPVSGVPTESVPAPVVQAAPPAQPIGSGSPQGVVIQSVPPGSILASLGLQPGDVVRSVNGESVTSEADIARILQQRGMQGSFSAEVQRGATTIPLAVSR